MSVVSHGIAPRRSGNGLGYMSTRHILEDLEKLLKGENPEQKRTELVIDNMLDFAKKTREGFEEFDRQSSKNALIWDHDTLALIKYAVHLERHLGSRKKAERFARALEKALEGYQDAVAAYDTPRFTFSSEEERGEVMAVLKKLIYDCGVLQYVFPDLEGSRIVWKR